MCFAKKLFQKQDLIQLLPRLSKGVKCVGSIHQCTKCHLCRRETGIFGKMGKHNLSCLIYIKFNNTSQRGGGVFHKNREVNDPRLGCCEFAVSGWRNWMTHISF